MQIPNFPYFLLMFLTVAFGTQIAVAAEVSAARGTHSALTQKPQQLEASYATELETLRTAIEKALPTISEKRRAGYLEAREAEEAAVAEVDAAQKALGAVAGAQGLVNHAKGKWIGGAEKGIAEAKAMLKEAKTTAERAAAQDGAGQVAGESGSRAARPSRSVRPPWTRRSVRSRG